MSEKMYEEAWNYTMEMLHNEYKNQNKEKEFVFRFNMKYVEETMDSITVSVSSQFLKDMMEKYKSFEIVQEKLREVTGQADIKLNCIISDEAGKTVERSVVEPVEKNRNDERTDSEKNSVTKIQPEIKEKGKHSTLDEKFTFESFIAGENSNFAYNASIVAAKEPGKKYNPLLLYGGSGLGKTHLMQAIGNYIHKNNPEKLKICYVSAENFTNEFILSTKEKTTTAFKNKYRNLDVLLLDDIHFLQGKEATQEELFYTFEALSQKKAQMVFTCDRKLREIKEMTERLVSRIGSGMIIDLQPPNYETRVAILQKKLDILGKQLKLEVVEYIAKSIESNVRELETGLIKVLGYMDLIGEEPSLEVVKKLLQDLISTNADSNISLDAIVKVIADNYQISVSDLKGKKRDKKFALPRQIAVYLSRELTEITYTELAQEFGKDHSTMMHSYEKIEGLIKTDPSMSSKIQIFKREIKEYKK